MSRSVDPGHFFQTSSALSESARKAEKAKNAAGNPIKLSSKLLAVVADPEDDGRVYVAESAGNVRRVALETSEIFASFTGPTAPVTSVAVSLKERRVLAGCWDKTIWSWSLDAPQQDRKQLSVGGHSDFVKTVLVFSLGGRDVLVSGGADGALCVWDVRDAALLYKLPKAHPRAVLALAIDPASHSTRLSRADPAVSLVSAGSDREIRAWRLTRSGGKQVGVKPLTAHETSVDALAFDAADDLWTASADRSAKCLSRTRAWAADTSLAHPDFVRAVAVDEAGGWVATACRDEEVRVWDKAEGKLFHTFSGHFEEVTGLVLLEPQQLLVSVSIDATVRRWSLKGPDLKRAKEEAERAREGADAPEEKEGKKESLMTEDEERELAELMEDDD
ncbi:uncharacterized protein K452DRAFT_220152 [Aplosporella prunicola CBS 121167]|uniref:Uncharacterized protein n=1 Tax=Aplosporella prunicola CBS 121167 TaxID=1176127 RepID=A0A6A6BTW5_9PEZI|nr:uncharacterized protein K452DRAFT_220152 [Aplosporella prunicola CBS 121167]KAF2146071.1 hypothetical protein K452DRAFT_220152 [Aplosporella prunicola CBS 121167]